MDEHSKTSKNELYQSACYSLSLSANVFFANSDATSTASGRDVRNIAADMADGLIVGEMTLATAAAPNELLSFDFPNSIFSADVSLTVTIAVSKFFFSISISDNLFSKVRF